MAITSAIVLFAVVWFMTFFIVLPLRLETQGQGRSAAIQRASESKNDTPQ